MLSILLCLYLSNWLSIPVMRENSIIIINITTVNKVLLRMIAPCKRIHEGSGFRIPASRFRIPASGFWISTLWIPDSIPKWIPDSKPLWIPDSSVWIPDSNSKNLLDSGFRILLHGARMTCKYVRGSIKLMPCLHETYLPEVN